MRKFMALGMVALLSLSLALALVSCQPKAETPAATDTTTPTDGMSSDTTMGGAMADSGSSMMSSDTTAH